jgi:hypothetical protein
MRREIDLGNRRKERYIAFHKSKLKSSNNGWEQASWPKDSSGQSAQPPHNTLPQIRTNHNPKTSAGGNMGDNEQNFLSK